MREKKGGEGKEEECRGRKEKKKERREKEDRRTVNVDQGFLRIRHTSDEEEKMSEHPPYNKYGFVDHPQLQMEDQRNKFAPYPLPPQEGNINGWLIEDANDSDLESTA
ncbi:hypothetical protein Tco_1516882 [Tanacetum coccineum]